VLAAGGCVTDATVNGELTRVCSAGNARGVWELRGVGTRGKARPVVGDAMSVAECTMGQYQSNSSGRPTMDVIRSHGSISTCQHCGGPMPPGKPTGRTRVYCTPACRKAAYEQRRARKPDATIVKVVEVTVTERERHDIGECVQATKASPAGCRNVLLHLLDLHKSGELYSDPKWSRLIGNAYSLGVAIATHTEQVTRDRGQTRWGR